MNGHMRVSPVVAVLSILVPSVGPVQAERCRPCEVAQERCSAKCFGLDKAKIGGCLLACGNEAATCSCDEAVTLSSEDFVARFGSSGVTEHSDACHSSPPCGSEYGSCAGWSSYALCGDTWCAPLVLGCGECGSGPESTSCGDGPALRQLAERYRVCFNALGESCTEYQVTTYDYGCGC